MNKYALAGFRDGIKKRASGLSLLANTAGGALLGAPIGAALESVEKDPEYGTALARGAMRGALAGAAKWKLKQEMNDMIAKSLRDFFVSAAQHGARAGAKI